MHTFCDLRAQFGVKRSLSLTVITGEALSFFLAPITAASTVAGGALERRSRGALELAKASAVDDQLSSHLTKALTKAHGTSRTTSSTSIPPSRIDPHTSSLKQQPRLAVRAVASAMRDERPLFSPLLGFGFLPTPLFRR